MRGPCRSSSPKNPSKETAETGPEVALESLTLSQRGGTVPVDGFTASVEYDDSAKLKAGMDVVLMLHKDRKTYRAAGRAGVFEIRDSRILPLVPRNGEHQRFAGMQPASFLFEILGLRRAIPNQ